MAEKPTDSFVSDYIKKQREIYRQQLMPEQDVAVDRNVTPPTPPEPEVGPLGKVIDFISRPLYAVTNVADKVLDIPEAFDRAQQLEASGQSGAGEALKSFGAVAAAPFTGFFSTKREDKNFFSDIIEKASDVSNRKDPLYKDVPDNVDPRVKGVAGFAGDVLFDPLTWVPAAWIAKGVQLGGRGLKAASGGAKAVTEDLKRTARTAREAEEANVAGRAVDNATEAARGSAVVEDVIAPAQATRKVADTIADAVKNKQIPKEVATASALREVVNNAKIMKRGRDVSLSNQLSKQLEKLANQTVDDLNIPVPGRELSRDEWLVEFMSVSDEGLSNIPIAAERVGGVKLKEQTLAGVNQVVRRLEEQGKMTSKVDQEINDIIEPYYQQFVKEVRNNPGVSLLGELRSSTNTEISGFAGVARLMYLTQQEEENVRAILGTPLFNNLKEMEPDEFASFVDRAQDALARNGVVENLGNVKQHTAEWNLLKRFNIDLPTYRAARADLEERINRLRSGVAAKPIDEAADTLDEDPDFVRFLTAELSDTGNQGLATQALNAIKNATRKVLYRNFDKDYLKRTYKVIKEDGELLWTSEEYGEGVARLPNLFGTFPQNDLWTQISMRGTRLFGGIPVRDASGNIVKATDGSNVYRVVPTYMKGKRAKRAYQGFDLANELERFVVPTTRAGEDFLANQGIPLVMDFKLPDAQRSIAHLRFSDVWRILDMGYDSVARANGVSRSWQHRSLQLLFFNTAKTQVVRTHVADAIMRMRQMAAAGIDDVAMREELLKVVRSDTNRTGTQKIDNWLSNTDAEATFGFRLPNMPKPDLPGVRYEPKGKTGDYVIWNAGVAAENLVDAIMAMRSTFDEVIDLRAQQYTARAVTEYSTVAPEIARQFSRMYQDPLAAAAAIRATNKADTVVSDYIRNVEGTELAAVFTDGAVSGVIPTAVKNAARSGEDIADAAGKSKKAQDAARTKAVNRDQKLDKQIEQEGQEAADYILGNPSQFGPEDLEAAQQLKAFDISNPFKFPDGYSQMQISRERVMSAFSATYGMDPRNRLSASIGMKSVGVRLRRFADQLNRDINENILQRPEFNQLVDGETTMLQAGMRLVQNGAEAGENATLASARAAIAAQVGKVFNADGEFINTIVGTSFVRSGAGIDELNGLMFKHAPLGKNADETARLPEAGEFFDMNLAAKDAPRFVDAAKQAIPGGSADEIQATARMMAALEQWKTWDIENVGHFLASTQSALYELSTKSAFIDNFFANAKRLGLATADPKTANARGFVKVTSDGASYFGRMLPQNMYLAPEVAETFQAADISMRTSRRLKGGLGDFTNTYLDPLLNKWKQTVTIFRTGHHIRNFIGGHSLRYFALGTSKFNEAFTKANQLLASRKSYTDVDMWASLRGDNVAAFGDTDTIVSGSKFKLTAADAYDDVNNNLFDVGRIAEDLLTAEIQESGFSRGVDVAGTLVTFGLAKPGGTVEKLALTASEYVEHQARASHYIQAMMQMADGKAISTGIGKLRKPKNLQEARQLAIESALKSHPNAASMTAFESKYMRRIFPFYSWFKPATVALVEASVMHPARTLTTIPKASYNLGIAMGIDPYSVYYPFPTDQMFPSFLTEEGTGPQFDIAGRYISIQPGFANLDIYNTFAGGPVEGAIQMINPYARVPMELLAGSRLGTQAPIRDFSDYIDSSIPGVNYMSNITGRSITGGLQPQEQVSRGVKTEFDQALSAFNWLTGLSARNYSRPNYINYAEIEERNRRAEELNQSQSIVDRLLGK